VRALYTHHVCIYLWTLYMHYMCIYTVYGPRLYVYTLYMVIRCMYMHCVGVYVCILHITRNTAPGGSSEAPSG